MYKKFFESKVDPDNLAKLMEQFNWRSAIGMKRDENVLQSGDSHTLKVPFQVRHGTRHNDTQHNDTQGNDIQHKDTQHEGTQHKDAQHNDTQFNDTQHNNTQNKDAN